MKVLIAVRRLDKGGAEMLECRLAVNLNYQGVETDLAGQYSPALFNGKEKAAYWNSLGVPKVHWLNATGSIGILKAIFKAYKLLKKEKYSALITHNSGLDTIFIIANLFIKAKHVVAFHDYPAKSKFRKPRFLLWRLLLPRVTHFYSITDFVNGNVCNALKIPKTKNLTIYNSIETTELPIVKKDIRRELNLPSDSKLILYAGRIIYRKGLDILLHTAGEILQKEKNTHLLILGEEAFNGLEYGMVGFKADILQEIKRLGIEEKVIFLGFRNDIYNIMSQSDLLLHLPRHEGFGLILLEAIALNLPIVASNAGGIPEVLKGTNYKTFSFSEKEEIKSEVKKYLSLTREERKNITEEAKKNLLYFTDKRRASEVKFLLEKVLKK